MLFFQVLLFGGYIYAHLLRVWLRPATQGLVHLALLTIALKTLPIQPSEAWKPSGDESPVLYLLWMLLAHVGLPYFVLSSTGPLIQAWLSYQHAGLRVYRLFALSNTGSLAALLSYPFLVEPILSVTNQSIAWSLMFCAFVLVQGMVAVRLFRVNKVSGSQKTQVNSAVPSWTTYALWLGLPALASTLLLVVTNHVCQDVAVIPFLWILPLSLYLISFIVCFDSPQWYQPKWTALVTLLAIGTIHLKELLPGPLQLVTEITFYMTMLTGVCLLCHGEVARLKPTPERLTVFYAMLSGGGALGGIIVAVVCPLMLNSYAELTVSLSAAATLSFLIFFATRSWTTQQYDWQTLERLRFHAALLVVAPTIMAAISPNNASVESVRNFFGVLRVQRDDLGLRLVHGTTIHGMQRTGTFANEPTTYYGRTSGIGQAMELLQAHQPGLRIGVVGVGCGVLAAYGRPADSFDMIDINPAVFRLANSHFTFLKNCPSKITRRLGDGRLVLERLDVQYNLLVLDAFSSDAIPAHLLTREAFELYTHRLESDGILAVHISNNHLDLAPLVHRLAYESQFDSRLIHRLGDSAQGTNDSTWMLIGEHDHWLWSQLPDARKATEDQLAHAPLWTDQHHNLVSVLNLW